MACSAEDVSSGSGYTWSARNYTFGWKKEAPINYFCVQKFQSKYGEIKVNGNVGEHFATLLEYTAAASPP
jgi:hypothetical protein